MTWGERLDKALKAYRYWEVLPIRPRMDRVFKEAGVRSLIVERDRYRQVLDYIAHSGTADPVTEAVAADAIDLGQPWRPPATNQKEQNDG